MKKLLLTTTAAIVFSMNAAFAQSIADQVISQLQAEGYDSIEVTNGPSQVKVEAIRDGMKLEAIYDAATGAILMQDVSAVGRDDAPKTGVAVVSDTEDFVDDNGMDDNGTDTESDVSSGHDSASHVSDGQESDSHSADSQESGDHESEGQEDESHESESHDDGESEDGH